MQELRQRLHGKHDVSAVSALPAVLLSLREVVVPSDVRQSLLKIGLSGVGAAHTGGWAGAAIAALAWKKILAIVVLVLGVGVLMRAVWIATVPPSPNPGGSGRFVSIEQVPLVVRQTIQTQTLERNIREIERKIDLGRTIYDIDFREGERMFEIRVRDDGTLVWKKPSS
jgi:hypothetical protein